MINNLASGNIKAPLTQYLRLADYKIFRRSQELLVLSFCGLEKALYQSNRECLKYGVACKNQTSFTRLSMLILNSKYAPITMSLNGNFNILA